MAKSTVREPKTPEVIKEMIKAYDANQEVRRPRKNEFTQNEIEDFLVEVGDSAWYDEEYLKRVHIQGDIPLPLTYSDLDAIRTIFVDKYFKKREKKLDKKNALTEKQEAEKKRLEAVKKRMAKK